MIEIKSTIIDIFNNLYSSDEILTGVQLIITAAIILIPAVTEHHLNPYQIRAKLALDRLRRKEDNIFDRLGLDERIEIETDEINVGYVEKGDEGFKILLDAISRNRAIDEPNVEAIGLLVGPVEIFEILDHNEAVPTSTGVLIGPNAGLFVDYNTGLDPERELVIYYKESPSLTVSLHQLELWVKESIRIKFHYLTATLAILWGVTSIMLLTN
jgi:hypothetical protein